MEVMAHSQAKETSETPIDWNVVALGSGIHLISGQHVMARACNTDGDGIAYITGPADFSDGIIRHSKFTARPGTICAPKDILITVKGSGVGTLVLSDANYCISRQLMAIRVENWSPKYVYYLLQRDASRLGGAATGLIPGLSRTDILDKKIPLPPTNAEQEAIAEALSDADALIESLEQLLAKKRLIKQGTMQELLTGKRRLPGFSGEWVVRPIGDLLTIMHGKGQHAVEDRNGKFPILASGGQIGMANSFLYDKPSVLIGRKGTIDQPRYIEVPFWTVDTLFYSKINEPNIAKFLFYRFCLIEWKAHNEASGVPSLNARTIEKIEIRCPPPDEQAAVAALLSNMDEELTALESKLTKARAIKQGMMQELLTGRIRLV